ncbi:MAG: sigma-70 family RNA polymerase sigma factor [Pirellulaceae bacterium]|nr:sigma-70 family RNA polymerase sigma factor [Pirellulaceae bacterium]
MATTTLREKLSKRSKVQRVDLVAKPVQLDLNSLRRRTKQLLDREIDFIGNREFSEPSARTRILETAADESSQTETKTRLPKDLPAHLGRLCESGLLTADEERDLFRKMNYLKFRANMIRTRLNPELPDPAAIAEYDALLAESNQVRDQIIKANMRLVISIVKKFVTPKHSFDDLLSDGIVSLMQAVDKFDYDKGFRFSTYAYRAIARNAFRSITERQKEESRFDASMSEDLSSVPEQDRTSALDEKEWMSMRSNMLEMLDQLDRRERFILRGRFALGAHRKVRTFQCLADKLGVSKERVRQLEQRAIAKLKGMVEKLRSEGPGATIAMA